MRVKIGHEVYDSNEVAIMVVFDSEEEKVDVSHMGNLMRFCSYPESMDVPTVMDFMRLPDDTD